MYLSGVDEVFPIKSLDMEGVILPDKDRLPLSVVAIPIRTRLYLCRCSSQSIDHIVTQTNSLK